MAEKAEIIFDVKEKRKPEEPIVRKKDDGSFDFESLKVRKRTVSPEKFEEMKKMYDVVFVQDYGDEYHMSEEERARKSKYYDAFAKIMKSKRKFRKIDEFIRAYRYCLDCLDLVAENNGVYDPEKFKKLVMRGKIEVFGLRFPKYIGKDRKEINWTYIANFIENRSLDPRELVIDKVEDLDRLSPEELKMRLFTKEEWDELIRISQLPEDIVSEAYDEDDENETRDNIVVIEDKKSQKKMLESYPDIIRGIRDIVKDERKEQSMTARLNALAYNLTQDDFEEIARIDQKYGYQSESDIPVFTGDIMKRKDYMRYLHRLEEFERTQIKVSYGGKMKTQEEIDEIELKDALEKAGWNLRNLYKSQNAEEKFKKAQKKDKKRENELKKKLIRLQARQKKREKGKVEFDVDKKKKKKEKKSKEKKESD